MKKLFFLFLFIPTFSFAQMTMTHHMPMAHEMSAPSTKDFLHTNHVMHMAMNIEYTGNPDIDFVRGMIPHHQGAIDMAKVVQNHGQNGNVKNFANKVIRDQTKEILSMETHLARLESDWKKNPRKFQNTTSIIAQKKSDKKMHHGMNIEFSGNADVDFIRGMIPHHQGAIDMAKIVLEHGQDPNVRTLAWAIVHAQDSEIYWMKNWLRKLKISTKF